MTQLALAYIGLGSNLVHPRRQLARALDRLARLPRTHLVAASPNYVSAPLDCDNVQADYVNAVAVLATALAPRALLDALLSIERRQGRDRRSGQRNAPRTLDLDLLLYGRRRIRLAHLLVPHARMHERAFVLRPLTDVAPTVAIPGRGAAKGLLRKVASQRIRRTRSQPYR